VGPLASSPDHSALDRESVSRFKQSPPSSDRWAGKSTAADGLPSIPVPRKLCRGGSFRPAQLQAGALSFDEPLTRLLCARHESVAGSFADLTLTFAVLTGVPWLEARGTSRHTRSDSKQKLDGGLQWLALSLIVTPRSRTESSARLSIKSPDGHTEALKSGLYGSITNRWSKGRST